jgi:hypothetical protein
MSIFAVGLTGAESTLPRSNFSILKKVKTGENTDDQQHLKAQRTKRTLDIVVAVALQVSAISLLPMGFTYIGLQTTTRRKKRASYDVKELCRH